MKIVVCIKQVPARDSVLRLNAAATWIQETDLTFEVNEPDIYALEEGLRLKEKHGGEVVLATLGPARAQQAIKEGLAKGADRALHLDDPAFAALDAFGIARALAKAIEAEVGFLNPGCSRVQAEDGVTCRDLLDANDDFHGC